MTNCRGQAKTESIASTNAIGGPQTPSIGAAQPIESARSHYYVFGMR